MKTAPRDPVPPSRIEIKHTPANQVESWLRIEHSRLVTYGVGTSPPTDLPWIEWRTGQRLRMPGPA